MNIKEELNNAVNDKKQLLMIIGSIFIAILWGYYYFLYPKLEKETNKLKREISSINKQIRKVSALPKEYQKLKNNLDSLNNQQNNLITKINEIKRIEKLNILKFDPIKNYKILKQILEFTKYNNINIENMKISFKEDLYKKENISLIGEANYYTFTLLLKTIENKPILKEFNYIHIEKIPLINNNDVKFNIQFDFVGEK